MAFGGQDSLGGGPQLLCLLLCSSPDHRPAVLRVTCQGPLQGAWLPGGLLLDAPPWVGLGLKRPSPAQVVASEDALGRCPGPGSVPAAIPGPAWRLCFYLLILFYPAFFVVFLRRAHLSNLPARTERPAHACSLPVYLSFSLRPDGPRGRLCAGGLGADAGGWAPRVLGPPRRPPPPGPRCA